MFETDDGYRVFINPLTGLITRISLKDSEIIEIRSDGVWVPDRALLLINRINDKEDQSFRS